MHTLSLDTKVTHDEHPNETGRIVRHTERGYIIEWVHPRTSLMPYGSANLEAWSFADAESLRVVEQA